MFFTEKNFPDRQGIPKTSEINNIAQVGPRYLGAPGSAASRQTGLAKFDSLAVLEDRKPTFNVKLAHVRPEADFDAPFLLPFLRFFYQFIYRNAGILPKRLR